MGIFQCTVDNSYTFFSNFHIFVRKHVIQRIDPQNWSAIGSLALSQRLIKIQKVALKTKTCDMSRIRREHGGLIR